MKGALLALFAGASAALGIAAIKTRGFSPRLAARLTTLNINSASVEELAVLGFDSDLADRIIENRPYRSKIDLLQRMVISSEDYKLIKNRISIRDNEAHDSIRVAS